jgi:ubiquinone/menaquinone biosynthesis C-methylase UbiE
VDGDNKADALEHTSYIPALSFHWLTPAYDLVLTRLFPEAEIKQRVAIRAAVRNAQVLDIGCGTGTLAILLRQGQDGGIVAGADIDGAMLATAQRKAHGTRAGVDWIQSRAESLAVADACVEVVVSSLMLHHLKPAQKLAALREAHRVLKPGGMLYIADFGPPAAMLSRLVSRVTRHLEEVADNIDGVLPHYMMAAGFVDQASFGVVETVVGTVVLLQACKPQGKGAG